MNSIYVCFNIKPVSNCLESSDALEENYQEIYKPLCKFLYSHPDFAMSFSFTGPQLNYFKKRKNEILLILKELVERKQSEILGGGFYNPIFPLIYPVDRNGQIDTLSTEIRQQLGKRPRGIQLFADSWDSSLVNNLQSSGLEYVLLDSHNIPSNKIKYLPIVMSDMGKSIEIYPTVSDLIDYKSLSVKDFSANLIKLVEKMEKKDKYLQNDPERIVTISLSHEQLKVLLEKKWLENLEKFLFENPENRIKLTTVSNYRKNNSTKVSGYISSGFGYSSDGKTANNVFEKLYEFPQSHALYNRMMYVSMLVNQYKNDKMKKKSAREKLWQAQSGNSYLSNTADAMAPVKFRQEAYKNLMDAEKILRDENTFRETILSFDYNGDGQNEYICRMQNYFSCISLTSGAICDFEPFKNAGNYADNLCRTLEYEGISDDYYRGIFVDHIFNQEQYDDYVAGANSGNGVFSRINYSELKYTHNHHEIQLCANAIFTPTKQKVYLRKKYIINSDGMNVQYILRNESDKRLKVKFAVESNFANTSFDKSKVSYMGLDVIDDDEITQLDGAKSTKQLLKKNKLKKVDFIRLNDTENGISFAFEPNENCKFFYMPLIFKRKNPVTNQLEKSEMTSVSTMIWDVDIEPGKETEKNINFTISALKKIKKN